ncbi:MAG: phosphohydrolase, partial [Atopobiaceae bacterium]|nr:phosphohydrolase [Atopobiaceae bacterium]
HDYLVHPNEKSVGKALRRIEKAVPGRAFPLLRELLVLKRADAFSKDPRFKDYAYTIDEVEKVLRSMRRNRGAFRIADLAISGKDVMEALSIDPGPEVGIILNDALSAVMNGEVANTREALISWVKRS